jgi:hypothetical protein
MVVSYTIEGGTFRANPPQKWSEQPISGRPTSRLCDLHPDGDRIVVGGDPATSTAVDRVVLVTNFLDDVRRRLSEARRYRAPADVHRTDSRLAGIDRGIALALRQIMHLAPWHWR